VDESVGEREIERARERESERERRRQSELEDRSARVKKQGSCACAIDRRRRPGQRTRVKETATERQNSTETRQGEAREVARTPSRARHVQALRRQPALGLQRGRPQAALPGAQLRMHDDPSETWRVRLHRLLRPVDRRPGHRQAQR
jgi:hypothetical protein